MTSTMAAEHFKQPSIKTVGLAEPERCSISFSSGLCAGLIGSYGVDVGPKHVYKYNKENIYHFKLK